MLGEIGAPGVMPFEPDLTVLKAIASRGGYSERAYRQKILVIRGSLTEPKTFVVNVAEIMSGRIHDMKLEPRDIVYVSRKPWAKAAELLETAINAFANSAVITYTGLNVKPIITEPVF